MQLTAELSLYPFDADYLVAIEDFIRRLQRHDGLTVVTNQTSTHVVGSDDSVFAAVQAELRESARRYPDLALVCKFIPKQLPVDRGPITP